MTFMILFNGMATESQNARRKKIEWLRWMDSLQKRGMLKSGTILTQNEVSDSNPDIFNINGCAVVKAESKKEALEIIKQAPAVATEVSVVIKPYKPVLAAAAAAQ